MGEEVTRAFGAAGTLLKAAAMFRGGEAAASEGAAVQRAREFEATQIESTARQERAMATQKASGEARKGRLVQSALTARAAASGGSATDPSVLSLAGQIAEEVDLRKRLALFEGEIDAQALEAIASGRRATGAEARRVGKIKRQAARSKGFTTLFDLADDETFETLFKKFGEG